MKKILIALCAIISLTSCRAFKEEFGKLGDEWTPVVTCRYDPPADFVPVTEEYLRENENLRGFTSIRELKALYTNGPLEIEGNIWIKGRIVSTDVTGNIYREMYIQDETGGIDLKVGKSSLYSEYRLGQHIYVKCEGLTLGAYNGMPQLGLKADDTSTNEYETSYIDSQPIIDTHIFKGIWDTPLEPEVITESDITTALSQGFTGGIWGKLVTIKGLKYDNQVFVLFYPNPNMSHKSTNPENRVFMSDKGTWGIDTWALSKPGFVGFLRSGAWDTAEVGSGATRYGIGSILKTPAQVLPKDSKELDSFGNDAYITYKEISIKYATANYVSHYFKLGNTSVQVRTSGYAKFADTKLDPRLAAGSSADITGILSIYNGAAQFSLVNEPSVSVVINE